MKNKRYTEKDPYSLELSKKYHLNYNFVLSQVAMARGSGESNEEIEEFLKDRAKKIWVILLICILIILALITFAVIKAGKDSAKEASAETAREVVTLNGGSYLDRNLDIMFNLPTGWSEFSTEDYETPDNYECRYYAKNEDSSIAILTGNPEISDVPVISEEDALDMFLSETVEGENNDGEASNQLLGNGLYKNKNIETTINGEEKCISIYIKEDDDSYGTFVAICITGPDEASNNTVANMIESPYGISVHEKTLA